MGEQCRVSAGVVALAAVRIMGRILSMLSYLFFEDNMQIKKEWWMC